MHNSNLNYLEASSVPAGFLSSILYKINISDTILLGEFFAETACLKSHCSSSL